MVGVLDDVFLCSVVYTMHRLVHVLVSAGKVLVSAEVASVVVLGMVTLKGISQSDHMRGNKKPTLLRNTTSVGFSLLLVRFLDQWFVYKTPVFVVKILHYTADNFQTHQN